MGSTGDKKKSSYKGPARSSASDRLGPQSQMPSRGMHGDRLDRNDRNDALKKSDPIGSGHPWRPSMLGKVSLPSAKDLGLEDRAFEDYSESSSDFEHQKTGGSYKTASISESPLPAWELPISPLDKTFRTRIGSPLGTHRSSAPLRPPAMASIAKDEDGSDDSDGSAAENRTHGVNVPVGWNTMENNDPFKRYKDAIKRSIMDVVGPFLREAGFSTDSGHLCFNKEILHQISEAIAKSTSEESRPISVAASLRKIKDFEGCGVRETYSFLIEYLCSTVEDLVYDGAVEPLNSSNHDGAMGDDATPSDASVDGDDAVDAAEIREEDENISKEWTHPLIVELLRKNASLRDYVKARTSGQMVIDTSKPLSPVPSNMNVDETMSFSSTDSMEGSASEDADGDDGSLDKDPGTSGQQGLRSNSSTGRTHSALSPQGRSSPSTLDTSNVRSNESLTRDLLVPKTSSPSKRDSPTSHKEAQIVDSLQKLSPMSDSERRRRRKHRSTPYDDSSSAGNETEEEMRKEKYKNTPYDDSSSADDAEDEKYRRAKHQSLYHDDSTSAGNQTEEDRRKQRHMNVPYDDSSTAGEETDENDRKFKHEHLPYDDSSSAEDEDDNDGADKDAARGWDDVDEEEVIRRKYRQDYQLSSPRNSSFKSSSPVKVGTSPIKISNTQIDEDYEFASSVVKYWDQLLLGPGTDLDTESENLDTAGMLDTSQSQMKSHTSRSHSANEGVAASASSFNRGSPLAKSQSRDAEVTFDKFKQMSDQERHNYLYDTLESATQTAKRLDFIGSDYTETLKDEITDLANLLGLDPNEVLEGRVQEQMGHSPQKVEQAAGGSRQDAYIQKATKRKKSKRSKRARRQKMEVSRLSLSSPRRPDVPKIMAPVSTLKQSPAVKLGPPKQSVQSSTEFLPSSRTSSSLGPRLKTQASSASSINRGRKSVPQGSVSYVSVSRSGTRIRGDEIPNYYSDEAVPRNFSPSKQNAQYATRLAQRQSLSKQTMDDTNIVVVNNRPYFPSTAGIQSRQRPSSAPPLRPSVASFKSPVNAQSASSSKRPVFKVSVTPRPLSPNALRSSPPPKTFVASVKQTRPKQKVRTVTSSLSAPTMSSLARANDILTHYLDFIVRSKPSVPWDQYSRKVAKRVNK